MMPYKRRSANNNACGNVVHYGSAIYQLGPAVQPSVVVVYIDSDC